MSRRRAAEIKNITPDANYKSIVIAKFINYLMQNGKKAKAEKIVYESIDNLSGKIKKEPVEAFEEIVDNLRPLIEVKSRRVGGATYQVPMEVRSSRALALALKWLVNAARSRKSEKTMVDRLSNELIDAYNKKGMAYKKKEDTHKMAEANKAFSHYRW
ncbi:30S ribosomal protein S7 [Rickettsiales endosymbiont of Trichoplax sp. H2]|uniref:30S ribosomal protein S7 n=1 Tax=Rickettsiales endosymbiont of Trichoplax sp. H2 TaxID=2021221 RepID=UPI0012B1E396|nr:30S ribosomal protein S7 [Rickettsiales endosymbiont of Trichoplax sp. H2]MSO13320.1 30S ribosomal protein S7 [Rickettsiales endosymbiont of Trichoplax sp. H2]